MKISITIENYGNTASGQIETSMENCELNETNARQLFESLMNSACVVDEKEEEANQ